jgi:Zn finger protein HypA/HybF involved in hydrogenase expression
MQPSEPTAARSRRWINCPLCGSSDTRADPEDEGWIIYCTNLACPSNALPDESPAAQGREITIHECAECGYIEGESPQAGCCPRCGIKSDAVPVKVRRV